MTRFPDQLDLVPAEQHLKEAVGLGFGGVAIGSALVFLAYSMRLVSIFQKRQLNWRNQKQTN